MPLISSLISTIIPTTISNTTYIIHCNGCNRNLMTAGNVIINCQLLFKRKSRASKSIIVTSSSTKTVSLTRAHTKSTGEKMLIDRAANIRGAVFKATENDTLSPLLKTLFHSLYMTTPSHFQLSFALLQFLFFLRSSLLWCLKRYESFFSPDSHIARMSVLVLYRSSKATNYRHRAIGQPVS